MRFLLISCFFIMGVLFEKTECAEPFPHVELLIKLPTRERPDIFFQILDLYYDYLSHEVSYHFVITCDEDDPSMNCIEVREKLNKYKNLTYYFGHSKTKIEACNADMENHLDFDVLLLASDDMIPRVQKYDLFIMQDMHQFFPEMDGLLHYDEGHVKARYATLPVIGKLFYDRFGYIYYPEYASFYCDNEMTEVSKMINKHIYIDHLLIEHVNPDYFPIPRDALNLKNCKFGDQDTQLYYQRKKINFGL